MIRKLRGLKLNGHQHPIKVFFFNLSQYIREHNIRGHINHVNNLIVWHDSLKLT